MQEWVRGVLLNNSVQPIFSLVGQALPGEHRFSLIIRMSAAENFFVFYPVRGYAGDLFLPLKQFCPHSFDLLVSLPGPAIFFREYFASLWNGN
jgi:hypothetical protein